MKRIVSAVILFCVYVIHADELKPLKASVLKASGFYKTYASERCVDGVVSDDSRWIGKPDGKGNIWIEFKLPAKVKVGGVHVYSGFGNEDAISDFNFQFRDDSGGWIDIPSAAVVKNIKTSISLEFDTTVEVYTDMLRLVVTDTKSDLARVKEIVIWPESDNKIPAIGNSVEAGEGAIKEEAPLIYLNQSGFNYGKPKRFTAPLLSDGTPFDLINQSTGKTVFSGVIQNRVGDFSQYNSFEDDEYVVRAGKEQSFPFRIGHWWFERVSYQNAVDFMIGSRHLFGTYRKECRGSYGWRDDHHFGWELNTLVPQYLSNPVAYVRMPGKIRYEQVEGKNGALLPYDENAPDIIKLIHYGADVIVTQELDHEFLKEQLSFFLYAWPYIKQWLPEQNYKVVSEYAYTNWEVDSIKQRYPYDISNGHNILALKTEVGTTKGQLPPGHTVLPNLLMYEVAQRDKRSDADKFIKAASKQVKWIVENLDWNDPLTTKGQRMSEHITMTGLAVMLCNYADYAPAGLKQKIEEWKKIMVSRSDNMWDFRKLSESQWVPTGEKKTMWNEPGNVIGFPASLIASMLAVPDSFQNTRLQELVYSHLDNAFGRNPTGRHFSYDGPREIEGVDLGWYSYHHGGIGMLAEARFVFDGSPKNEHYPYNPQVGNVGWTEGWVQFNTAFNLSLAYMAYADTQIGVVKKGQDVVVRLKAPLNFDYKKKESVTVKVVRKGVAGALQLIEESENSAWFTAVLSAPDEVSEVSYGYGYFKHSVKLPLGVKTYK